jgi:hypothetical protein
LPEFLNHVFREASVGAADAGLSAFETLFYASHEWFAHIAAHVRVSGNHVAGLHLDLRNRLMCPQRVMRVNVPCGSAQTDTPIVRGIMARDVVKSLAHAWLQDRAAE